MRPFYCSLSKGRFTRDLVTCIYVVIFGGVHDGLHLLTMPDYLSDKQSQVARDHLVKNVIASCALAPICKL